MSFTDSLWDLLSSELTATFQARLSPTPSPYPPAYMVSPTLLLGTPLPQALSILPAPVLFLQNVSEFVIIYLLLSSLVYVTSPLDFKLLKD